MKTFTSMKNTQQSQAGIVKFYKKVKCAQESQILQELQINITVSILKYTYCKDVQLNMSFNIKSRETVQDKKHSKDPQKASFQS